MAPTQNRFKVLQEQIDYAERRLAAAVFNGRNAHYIDLCSISVAEYKTQLAAETSYLDN